MADEADDTGEALFTEKVDGRSKAARAAREPVEEERLHPILANDEFRAAQAEARAKVEKEKKANAKKDIIARETDRLRREEGLTTGAAEKDAIKHILIDLPPFAPNLRINGFEYTAGSGYDVPAHVYDTLKEMMFRAWRHEDQVEGKSVREAMAHRARRTVNHIDGSTGAVNRDARFDA